MNFFVKFISYVFSLIPLWILFWVQYGFLRIYFVLLVFYVVLGIISWEIIRKKRKSTKIPIKIVDIKRNNVEQLTYLMTYIIPFVFVNIKSVDGVVNTNTVASLIVILIMIGFIYCKTNLFSANPLIAIFGRNSYRAEIKSNNGIERCLVLSKKSLSRKMPIDVDGIYLVDDEVVLILDK